MEILQNLYQQMIIDHNKNPQNFYKLKNATHSADGHNPPCGDIITINLIEYKGII